ncbi:TetR/AcrR family transcriptional regulator [Actinomadura violacea]|uniref:TetR/AcrR family transcriptional regulator n=1 Tax=Actinomadura violacea TaxID=2819934 RepID=A0ABS3RMU3_9ACTN|nr:TetR/AcrR family transcriptional regulator [Actinomadura violacea]MBO2457389.1 TetR/AcrR family transcriptional regulator [Actinomadura violacea]
MPKIVDPEARRREVAEAVFRVVRRDGLEQASLRNVAAEAGLAIGSVRHYFAGQGDIMVFAMRYFAERAGERLRLRAGRLAAPDPAAPPAEHVASMEALFAELLPVDTERREEAEVWLAFVVGARTRPGLRPLAAEMHDALRSVAERVLRAAERVGVLRPGLDIATEAARVHTLVDGLTLHAVLRPESTVPQEMRAVLRRHVRELTTVPAGDLPEPPGLDDLRAGAGRDAC